MARSVRVKVRVLRTACISASISAKLPELPTLGGAETGETGDRGTLNTSDFFGFDRESRIYCIS